MWLISAILTLTAPTASPSAAQYPIHSLATCTCSLLPSIGKEKWTRKWWIHKKYTIILWFTCIMLNKFVYQEISTSHVTLYILSQTWRCISISDHRYLRVYAPTNTSCNLTVIWKTFWNFIGLSFPSMGSRLLEYPRCLPTGRGGRYLEMTQQIFATILHTNGNKYTKIESCININNALILTFIHQNWINVVRKSSKHAPTCPRCSRVKPRGCK